MLSLQASAGNASVGRLARTLPTAPASAVLRSPASELIDTHTSWANLDEPALGRALLQRARAGEYAFVQQTLNELGTTDRDDLAYQLCAAASDADLQGFVAAGSGRALVDRMFDELTSGSVAGEEQEQADRLLRIKTARIDPEVFTAGMQTAKVFPYRLPGFTVLDAAPVRAERRAGGRVWVKQPVGVLGTDMFRAETSTLPADVFTSGMELPEDEVVGVRFYDLGGVLVYRPALVLVQLSNETTTNALTKIAEIAGIGLTLGTGALVGLGVRATMMARVLLWADRAAFVLGTLATVAREHRGEILARYGEDGRRFLTAVDYVQNATAIYGFARVTLAVPRLITGLRDAYRNLRAAGGDGPVGQLAASTEEVLQKADDIQGARPGPGGAASGGAPEGAPSPAASVPDAAPPAASIPEATPASVPQRGQSLSEIFGENYDFRLTDAMRDPVRHSNVVQLRRLALGRMQASGPNQPVKVVPLHYDPATAVRGDFTLAKFVLGRTPEQLARELGVTAFARGVRVYRLDGSVLNEANLNLRGYTQSPAGAAPSLSTPENLAKWPVGQGSVQYNTAVDMPVTVAVEVAAGVPARF